MADDHAFDDHTFAERLLGAMAAGLEDRYTICLRTGLDLAGNPMGLDPGTDVPVAPVAPAAQAPSSADTAAEPMAEVDLAPEEQYMYDIIEQARRDCSISPLSEVTTVSEVTMSEVTTAPPPFQQADYGVTQQIDTMVRSRKRRRSVSSSASGAPATTAAPQEVPGGAAGGAASGAPAGGGDGDMSGGDAPGAPGTEEAPAASGAGDGGKAHDAWCARWPLLPTPPSAPKATATPRTARARSDILPRPKKCVSCNSWLGPPGYCRRCNDWV